MYHLISFITLLVILLLPSCGGRSTVSSTLDAAESVMETAPDSALALLESVDSAALNTASLSARHALLKSMAYDKNYIDLTTLDIIRPAIDYYHSSGSPDEMLRTYYYTGRIYHNAGDEEEAMKQYVSGLYLAPQCADTLTICRMLVAQSIIFSNVYDWESLIENNLTAAELYEKLGYDYLKSSCMSNALNGALISDEKTLSDSIMRICLEDYERGYLEEEKIIHNRLLYVERYESKDSLRSILNVISADTALNVDLLLSVADGYNELGDAEKALSILSKVKEMNLPYDTIKYTAVSTLAYDSLHFYKNALDEYRDFNERFTKVLYERLLNKLQFSEQRYKLEIRIAEEKQSRNILLWRSVAIISFLVLGLALLWLFLKKERVHSQLVLKEKESAELHSEKLRMESERLRLDKEHLSLTNKNLMLEKRNLLLEKERDALESENLRHRISELEEETAQLSHLLESRKDMSPEVREAIKLRLSMLNSLLAEQIKMHGQKHQPYDEWVGDIATDATSFMDSTRLALTASHPGLIRYFEECGLTVDEINYLSLYAIGLRGKEVGTYINRRSHTNLSSAIRKKLGIDKHETNIGIYVRKLMKNY